MSAERGIVGLASLATIRRMQRRESRERYAEEGEFIDSDMAAFDAAFPKAMRSTERASEKLPGVRDDEAAALDTMLSRHGLRAILKSLRQLCDSRHDPFGCDQSFEDVEGSEKWVEAARELEHFLYVEKVNVK